MSANLSFRDKILDALDRLYDGKDDPATVVKFLVQVEKEITNHEFLKTLRMTIDQLDYILKSGASITDMQIAALDVTGPLRSAAASA